MECMVPEMIWMKDFVAGKSTRVLDTSVPVGSPASICPAPWAYKQQHHSVHWHSCHGVWGFWWPCSSQEILSSLQTQFRTGTGRARRQAVLEWIAHCLIIPTSDYPTGTAHQAFCFSHLVLAPLTWFWDSMSPRALPSCLMLELSGVDHKRVNHEVKSIPALRSGARTRC